MTIAVVLAIKTAKKLTKNPLIEGLLSKLSLGSIEGDPKIVSSQHRRSIVVSIKENPNIVLSIKGVGWVHGPPWAYNSPKDDQLYFGLLDKKSGLREIAVSDWFQKNEILSTKVIKCVELDRDDLNLLGIKLPPRFKNGIYVEPVALVTESLSQFRVNDFSPAIYPNWLDGFNKLNSAPGNENSSREKIKVFCKKIVHSINRYQYLGATNDTLSADNVTLAGEITDFEWVYVPGIPLPDGWTDKQLFERQSKEAAYFIDIILSLCEGLQTSLTIKEIATIGLNFCSDVSTPFVGALSEIEGA
jgi:hypothetical protein